jgi:hypothetical protein
MPTPRKMDSHIINTDTFLKNKSCNLKNTLLTPWNYILLDEQPVDHKKYVFSGC